MANGHGGARIGAGQKKKALSDKLVEGNPGKRKLTVMEFTDTADLQGETMPPPRDYLAARQKNGKELLAVEVYERTWTWLHERGCAHLIPAQILEQYAMASLIRGTRRPAQRNPPIPAMAWGFPKWAVCGPQNRVSLTTRYWPFITAALLWCMNTAPAASLALKKKQEVSL